MYVNFLSTYSDKKSCHTSTILQTSIVLFVSDSWASCFLLDKDESCPTADLSNIGRPNGPAYSTDELLNTPQIFFPRVDWSPFSSVALRCLLKSLSDNAVITSYHRGLRLFIFCIFCFLVGPVHSPPHFSSTAVLAVLSGVFFCLEIVVAV